jgi:pyruvate/2-oxoglutarate dehydrogenase complex dihydrolipoamide dehydrogenase (E3) component/uncharacterized membrane protein YdjX (TVP38/TMEM64 family)
MNTRRWIVLALVVAAVAAFFALGLQRYVSLDAFAAQRARLDALVAQHPVGAPLAYFVLYVATAALSIPGATVLTLVGGALFGVTLGTVLVSFASALGATLAFLVARLLLGDWVQQRYGERLRAINAGIERDGALYLATLRLVFVFPFWLVNLLMGLTKIRTLTFYWVSQLAMLPATIVYVFAGSQLGSFRVGPGLVIALAALALLPWAARAFAGWLKARRVFAPWLSRKPARFDYNLVVIGAGSAGLVSAYIAAATRAKVALVEKHRMGGDCLNTGCVPSKALLRAAKAVKDIEHAHEFGITAGPPQVDFAAVMAHVKGAVAAIAPHDSVERYTALGVECIAGTAKITTPWTVEVATADGPPRVLTTRGIVIAAGARPAVPPIPGLAEAGYLTSDTLWDLRTLPPRLVVLGGGPIGCELAQAFARLGSRVMQVEMLPRVLAREDAPVSALVHAALTRDGVEVLTGHTARRVETSAGSKVVIVEHAGGERRIECDAILVALGRVANTAGYGLEELGIGTTPQRTVAADAALQTRFPNITVCGDAAGPYQFTHVAAHQAWTAAVNALFGSFRRFEVDQRVIPWVTFTDPEVARVGLSEDEARARGVPFELSVYGIDDLDRAIADGAAAGCVRVLTPPGSDRILGATIVGARAGELLAEMTLAMKHGVGLNGILGTIHAYPTYAEANKYVAGAWRRSRVTRGQQALLDAFQAWRRGAGTLGGVLARLPALRDKRPLASPEPHA